MLDIAVYDAHITTGVYRMGRKEQRALVDSLFTKENAEYYYEVYFHWYNVMHELGHALLATNADEPLHPVDEEQLVNDFAVAYWLYYGEAEKLSNLREIVSTTIPRFIRPTSIDKTFVEYAKEMWGHKELYNFNNYGWFQFHCVSTSLKKRINLESALKKLGGKNLISQKRDTFSYAIDDQMVASVLKDAEIALAAWGMNVPSIKLTYSNDLNAHMCKMLPK